MPKRFMQQCALDPQARGYAAVVVDDLHTAVPIRVSRVSKETFDLCIHVWKAVNNDHLVQLLILSL